MRGHEYSPGPAGGPCEVCGYGPGAPQHQATYGLGYLLRLIRRGGR